MTRYRDAVFAATHNSYAGDARGDLIAQLDAGVRGLELDVVRAGGRLVLGHGLPGLEVSHDGANPNDLLLASWLRRVAAWRGPGPLTLVLDLKSKLPSSEGPDTLTGLLDLLDDVFGARLVAAEDPSVLDTPTADLDGRVFAVISGSRHSRDRLRRDPGRDPVLAADARGRLLEVHAAPNGRDLWWWSGHDTGRALRWEAHGRPVFHRARRLGWGRDAHLSWHQGAFHAEFTAQATGDRVHRRGHPLADGTALQWSPAPARTPPPPHPAPVLPPDGAEAAVGVDPDGDLRWRRGEGPWRPLRIRELAWVELQPGDPVRLQRDGLMFCAASARSAAWGVARKAQGRVVRLWQVTEGRRPPSPVNFPATDRPRAAWYLKYLQEIRGEHQPPAIV